MADENKRALDPQEQLEEERDQGKNPQERKWKRKSVPAPDPHR